jgi:hypothetical protein
MVASAVHAYSDGGAWRNCSPTGHRVCGVGKSLARHGVAARLLPAVGHFLMLEDSTGFNRILDSVIEDFLADRS